jgi:hypothetical protein
MTLSWQARGDAGFRFARPRAVGRDGRVGVPVDRVHYGVDDLALFGVGEPREHRQGERPSGRGIGDGQIRVEAALHDVALAMDRNRIVDVGADAGPSQVRDDRVPLRAHFDRVLVEDVGPPVRRDRQSNREAGEELVVAFSDRLAPCGVPLELRELGEPDRCGDVGQPEVEAKHLEVVARPHALVPIQPQPVREAIVVRRDESAFGGRHVLRCVEAERAVAEAAGLSPAVGRAMRLARVLDDDEPVPVGDGPDHVHVGDETEQMDRADRPGSRGDGRFDLLRVDQIRVRLDVDEHGRRAGKENRVRGRGERVSDGDHLITRLEPDPSEDRHQRQRPVAHRNRVLHPHQLRPLGFELGDLAALRDHPAAQHLGDGGDLFGSQVGSGDRDHAGAPWRGPERSSSVSASGT